MAIPEKEPIGSSPIRPSVIRSSAIGPSVVGSSAIRSSVIRPSIMGPSKGGEINRGGVMFPKRVQKGPSKPSSLFGERKQWRQKDLDWYLYKKGSPYVRGTTTGILFSKEKRRGMIKRNFPANAYKSSIDEREVNTQIDILKMIEKGYSHKLTSRQKYYTPKEVLSLGRKDAERLRLYYEQNILRK